MIKEITGPTRPPKAFSHLEVDLAKVGEYEGVLDSVIGQFGSFDASKGYFHPHNQPLYDAMWGGIFKSLTEESLPDCVNIWLLSKEDYLPRILDVFGSEENYKDFVGHKPMDVAGVNLDGTWIIYRDQPNLAMLTNMYHEIGHRVYPKSADRYNRELGAYYFMFLAMKKTQIELSPHGLIMPTVDFREQITEDHDRALKEARRLVETNTKYVHRVQ